MDRYPIRKKFPGARSVSSTPLRSTEECSPYPLTNDSVTERTAPNTVNKGLSQYGPQVQETQITIQGSILGLSTGVYGRNKWLLSPHLFFQKKDDQFLKLDQIFP